MRLSLRRAGCNIVTDPNLIYGYITTHYTSLTPIFESPILINRRKGDELPLIITASRTCLQNGVKELQDL